MFQLVQAITISGSVKSNQEGAKIITFQSPSFWQPAGPRQADSQTQTQAAVTPGRKDQ